MKKYFLYLSICVLMASFRPDYGIHQNTSVLYSKNGLKIELETDNIANTVENSANAKLIFKNIGNNKVSLEIQGSVLNFDDSHITFTENLSIGSKSTKVKAFPVSVFQKKGIKWVSLKVKTERITDTVHFSMAYMRPIGNEYQSDFKFGIAGIRYGSVTELPPLYAFAKQVGIQYERKYARWKEIQPDSLTWQWDKFDAELKAMADKNIHRELLLTGTPPWAVSGKYANRKKKSNVPPKLKYWKIYVDSIATRYKDRVKYYEIWNEPDFGFFIGSTKEYLEVLKTAYREIKDIDPSLKVLSGGFASTSPRPQFFQKRGDLHKDAVRLGQNYFDIHAVHLHGTYDSFKHQVDGKLKEIRDQLDSFKPLWFNETAMHSTFIGEKEQGKVLYKKMTLAMARNAMGYCWFCLKDNAAYSMMDPEHNYGMLTVDNNPKAVYVVYNEMVTRMKDKAYVKDVNLGKGYQAFLFKGGNEYQLNTWKEDIALPDQIASFKVSDNTRVLVEDLMGNQHDYKVVNGVVNIPISKAGRFIRFMNTNNEPTLKKPLFKIRKALVVNENMKLHIPVHGAMGKRLDLKVFVKGKLLDNANVDSGEISILLREKVNHLQLQVKNKDGLDEILELPLAYPLFVNNNKKMDGRAPIYLKEYSEVVNKYEHDPNTSDLTWKGPKDLSVKAWLSIDNKNLYLDFQVMDDRHVQKDTGALQYKGDGVQVAIKARGMQNFWEVGYAFTDSSHPDVAAWSAPSGYKISAISHIELSVKRTKGVDYYQSVIPLDKFGLDKIKDQGIYFSFIVNDNDTDRREGWMQLTEGLAGSKNPDKFEYIIFK